MFRQRATAIVINKDRILLIYRKNNGREYYVFPGGSVEANETPEEAVLRELKEEASITAKVVELADNAIYSDGTENFAYVCQYVSGEPQLDDEPPEKKEMAISDQYYEPMWIAIDKLANLDVFPSEAKEKVIQEYIAQNSRQSP